MDYPSEVWAVEYTTIGGERRVEIVGSKEEAMMFSASATAANPFILRSAAEFRPLD